MFPGVFNLPYNNLSLFCFVDVYYNCLGEWFVGKNHYFAAMNTKESRKEEKYRCFVSCDLHIP